MTPKIVEIGAAGAQLAEGGCRREPSPAPASGPASGFDGGIYFTHAAAVSPAGAEPLYSSKRTLPRQGWVGVSGGAQIFVMGKRRGFGAGSEKNKILPELQTNNIGV